MEAERVDGRTTRHQMTAIEGHPQSKYTPELRARIVELIESGMKRRAACDAAGIHESTLAKWIHDDPAFHNEIKQARERAGRGNYNQQGKARLTPEMQAIIVQAMGLGVTVAAAAALAGISRVTLGRWLDEDEPDYNEELAEEVDRQKAMQLVNNLNIIQNAATQKQTWQAAAWLNERLYPESFALGRGREAATGKANDPVHTTNALIEEAAAMLQEQRRELAMNRMRELGVDTSQGDLMWQPPQLPAE